MEYKIMSNPLETSKETRLMIDEIKDKYFEDLYVQAKLNESEIMDLINAIIKDDTEIDFNEYDITLEKNYGLLSYNIEDDYDLTNEEKKYIKKELTKKYGTKVLDDIIHPVIIQKLNTEHYELCHDEYFEKTMMTIDIPLDNFHKKNEICRYLNAIE